MSTVIDIPFFFCLYLPLSYDWCTVPFFFLYLPSSYDDDDADTKLWHAALSLASYTACCVLLSCSAASSLMIDMPGGFNCESHVGCLLRTMSLAYCICRWTSAAACCHILQICLAACCLALLVNSCDCQLQK